MINHNGKYMNSPNIIPNMMNPQANYYNQPQGEMNPNIPQMNYPRSPVNPQMMERNPQMAYANSPGNMMTNPQYYAMMNTQGQNSQSQLYPGNFNPSLPNQGIRMPGVIPPGMNMMNTNSPRGQINSMPTMNMAMAGNNMAMAQIKNQGIMMPQSMQGMNKSPRGNPMTIPNMQNMPNMSNMNNMNSSMSQGSTMNTSNMSSIPFIKITNDKGANPMNPLPLNTLPTSNMSNCSPRSNPQYPPGYSVTMSQGTSSPSNNEKIIPNQQQQQPQQFNSSPLRNTNSSPIASLNYNQLSPLNPQMKIPQVNKPSPIQVMNPQIPRPVSPGNQGSIPMQASPNRNAFNDFQASMQMMSMISKNLMLKQNAELNKSPQPMTNMNPNMVNMGNMANMANMPYMNNNIMKSPTMPSMSGLKMAAMQGMSNMQAMNNLQAMNNMQNMANMAKKPGMNGNMNANSGNMPSMNPVPSIPNMINIPNLGNMVNMSNMNNMNNTSTIPNMPINPYLINKICTTNMTRQNQTQRAPINTGFKHNITIANGNGSKKVAKAKPPVKVVKSEKNILKNLSSSSISHIDLLNSKDKLTVSNLLIPFNAIKDNNNPVLSLQFILPGSNGKVIEVKNSDNLQELLAKELKDISPEMISIIINKILYSFKQAKQLLSTSITQSQKKRLYRLKQNSMRNTRKPTGSVPDRLNCSCHFEEDLHDKEIKDINADIEKENCYPVDLNVTY